MALVPNCSDPVVPLVSPVTWRGGTCYMGNSSSSISHRPGLHPTTHIRPRYTTPHQNTLHRIWRGHSSFALGVDTTRGTTVTGYKLPLDWRRAQRQGSFSLVGGILSSHWTAIARHKLGSPQPVRCCPATVCLLHWVLGHPTSRP